MEAFTPWNLYNILFYDIKKAFMCISKYEIN